MVLRPHLQAVGVGDPLQRSLQGHDVHRPSNANECHQPIIGRKRAAAAGSFRKLIGVTPFTSSKKKAGQKLQTWMRQLVEHGDIPGRRAR